MQLSLPRQLAIVVGGGVVALVVVLIGMLAGQTSTAPRVVGPPQLPQVIRGITLPLLPGLALPPSTPQPPGGLDSFMGSRWQPPYVTIDNQVGPAFTPILEAAVAAWRAAGVPIAISTSYGGPTACDDPTQPTMGTVVVCLHSMPLAYAPGTTKVIGTEDGDTNLLGDETQDQCDSPRCPAISGVVWLKGSLSGARLANVVRHEVGHVLGISYAVSRSDVMNIYAPVPTITSRDVASLDWLYGNAA
jgi:hypothetical protein